MDTISVTIITRNEAADIGSCIESANWADEIVVVDQFSPDDTAKIAEQSGATVYREAWRGFSEQKNMAIQKATKTWILSLDADERISPQLRDEIQRTITGTSVFAGYYIPRKNFFCDQWIRHGGWNPDYTLRLFRRKSGRFAQRAVHEKVVVDGPIGYLTQPLIHYTYRTISDFLQRMDEYSALAAMEIRPSTHSWIQWERLVFRPLFTFIKMFLLRRGALDGSPGFFLAVSYAYYTFLKYYRCKEERVSKVSSEIGGSGLSS